MKKLLFILLLILSQLNAEVITIKSEGCKFKEISKNDLKFIFMGAKKEYKNQEVKFVYNENENDKIIFFQKFLSKNENQMKSYWTKMIYTGKKQPPEEFNFKNIDKIINNNCVLFFINEKEEITKHWEKINVI
jgi:hypothetical protein